MNKVLKQLKNWLLLNKLFFLKKNKTYFLICFVFFYQLKPCAQICNYITNGGFESLYNCTGFNSLVQAKGWRTIDSSVFNAVKILSVCYSNVPNDGANYQYPKSGLNFAGGTFLCQPPQCPSNANRGYLRNRLKSNLINGKIYCVKLYVNVRDVSTYGLSNISVFFESNIIDTISKCNIPLTYIIPQVENPTTNILTDTMNWVSITGTFVANGTEKNCVIGNFKSDAATTKTLINPTNLPTVGCDILIDDVSCIPLDLPAYAGPDVYAPPSSTVYIGRPQDVGIDEACTWFKLPNTTSVIAQAAGITVTVAATSTTYMVKQTICGTVKYDTVVVYPGTVGLNKYNYQNVVEYNLYPNPATNLVYINSNNQSEKLNITINDINGKIVMQKNINIINYQSQLNLDLINGIYFVNIINEKGEKTVKKLIIAK